MVYNFNFIKGRNNNNLAFHQWYFDDETISPESRFLVLVIHGYADHMRRQKELVNSILEQNRNAIVFGIDRHGHGMSDGERALIENMDDVVADLHTAIRHVKNIHTLPENPRLIVSGHSLGSLLTVLVTDAYRVEENIIAIILGSPLLGDQKVLEWPNRPFSPSFVTRDENELQEMLKDQLFYLKEFHPATLVSFSKSLEHIKNNILLGDIPTLWLQGDDDEITKLEYSKQGINDLNLSKLESKIYIGARHDIYHEINRNEIFGVLNDFITKYINSEGVSKN